MAGLTFFVDLRLGLGFLVLLGGDLDLTGLGFLVLLGVTLLGDLDLRLGLGFLVVLGVTLLGDLTLGLCFLAVDFGLLGLRLVLIFLFLPLVDLGLTLVIFKLLKGGLSFKNCSKLKPGIF